MKIIKNLLCLSFLISIVYACEPEELTERETADINNVSADTGDQEDVTHTGEEE